MSRPEVIFADEPTGNLDSRSGAEVLGFLQRSVREFGQTIVMVTHDPNAASYADHVTFLGDGQIVDELAEPTADTVLERMRRLDPGADTLADHTPDADAPAGEGVAVFRAMLRGLLAHKLRLLLSSLAVVLGTMFMSGAFIGGDTLATGFDRLFTQVNTNLDVQVTAKSSGPTDQRERPGSPPSSPQAMADRVKTVDGVAVPHRAGGQRRRPGDRPERQGGRHQRATPARHRLDRLAGQPGAAAHRAGRRRGRTRSPSTPGWPRPPGTAG